MAHNRMATDDGVALNGEWARSAFSEARTTDLPFSFVYGGKPSGELVGGWKRTVRERAAGTGKRVRTLTLSDPATRLVVRAIATIYTSTAGVDWVLHFTNEGDADSLVIEQVRALDARFETGRVPAVTLHRLNGSVCQPDDWLPFDQNLALGERVDFAATSGRSSNVSPFFTVDWGTGGVTTAIGWSGQWCASVARPSASAVEVKAGMETMWLKLRPGESIRSPRILRLRWQGGDHYRAYNLFRRTMFAHIMPRKRGRLIVPPIAHMTTSFYELNDTTERDVLSHLESAKGLGFEALWLDAYWTRDGFPDGMGHYGFPITRAEPKDRFPNGIRPSSDAAHAARMMFVQWFEPERVAPNTELAREHPEWLLSPDGNGGLLNLGIPEARDYMTEYLKTVIRDYGIDWLRIDYNIDPLDYWKLGDAADPDRVGMTEIRYVEGVYRMWDDLRAAFPGLPIDNCASGGRRIDLETCSRSIPLWRTDATIGPIMRNEPLQAALQNQVMSAGLNRYVPFNVSGQTGSSPYLFRSGFNAGASFGEDIRRPDYPRKELKAGIAEGKRIRRYYFGDFYPISEVTMSPSDWCVTQYHRPTEQDGMVMAFRRPDAPAAYSCRLREIDRDAEYTVRMYLGYDLASERTMKGDELRSLSIRIEQAPGSAILEYARR